MKNEKHEKIIVFDDFGQFGSAHPTPDVKIRLYTKFEVNQRDSEKNDNFDFCLRTLLLCHRPGTEKPMDGSADVRLHKRARWPRMGPTVGRGRGGSLTCSHTLDPLGGVGGFYDYCLGLFSFQIM